MKKLKDKVNRKKIILIISIIILILLTLFLGLLIFNQFNNDGMKQAKGISIHYRTYTDENGWSKWSKNGKTSGDLKNNIKNIQVKIITSKYTKVIYALYNEGWSNEYTIDSKIENKNIYGIKMSLSDELYKDYNIYYRTYNANDKWLDWSFAGYANGNINEAVKAIEIKIVPKGTITRDYLKDFNNTNNKSNIGF